MGSDFPESRALSFPPIETPLLVPVFVLGDSWCAVPSIHYFSERSIVWVEALPLQRFCYLVH